MLLSTGCSSAPVTRYNAGVNDGRLHNPITRSFNGYRNHNNYAHNRFGSTIGRGYSSRAYSRPGTTIADNTLGNYTRVPSLNTRNSHNLTSERVATHRNINRVPAQITEKENKVVPKKEAENRTTRSSHTEHNEKKHEKNKDHEKNNVRTPVPNRATKDLHESAAAARKKAESHITTTRSAATEKAKETEHKPSRVKTASNPTTPSNTRVLRRPQHSANYMPNSGNRAGAPSVYNQGVVRSYTALDNSYRGNDINHIRRDGHRRTNRFFRNHASGNRYRGGFLRSHGPTRSYHNRMYRNPAATRGYVGNYNYFDGLIRDYRFGDGMTGNHRFSRNHRFDGVIPRVNNTLRNHGFNDGFSRYYGLNDVYEHGYDNVYGLNGTYGSGHRGAYRPQGINGYNNNIVRNEARGAGLGRYNAFNGFNGEIVNVPYTPYGAGASTGFTAS